jgi:hypothetical protein
MPIPIRHHAWAEEAVNTKRLMAASGNNRLFNMSLPPLFHLMDLQSLHNWTRKKSLQLRQNIFGNAV